ncbi:MAG TPA: site-2 protease family protein [Gemmataceae bacterium]|nr:site-2 protease family protein [Gemmataceae bacterium]
MLRSFKLGKLFGIPLYIHSTFILLPIWILLTNRGAGLATSLFLLLYLIAVFTCVVLHELGHALMARFFGIGTESITLFPIGGVARLERMSEKPSEEIAIALAGPAVNLVIAALLAPVALIAILSGAMQGDALFSPEAGVVTVIGRFTTFLWFANVMLLAFNLIPCFPMDGGRVLRALLSLGMGHLRATEMAARIGLLMAFLIASMSVILPVVLDWAANPMLVVLALFVLFAGQQELWMVRRLDAQRRMGRLAQPIPQPELVSVSDEPRPRSDVPFSGVAWDSRYRVWVKWHNGHPVAYWG